MITKAEIIWVVGVSISIVGGMGVAVLTNNNLALLVGGVGASIFHFWFFYELYDINTYKRLRDIHTH